TAALIKASCEMGCIVGDGNENQIKAAREYGRCIGLVFQIIDDVLDITSTKEVLGKPIKSDEESGKTTFVNLYGVEKSIEIAKQTTAEAIDYLSVFKNKDNLVNLANFLLKRKS
ncbi:MAG: polyprenyl synthetase family protein, partial [Clostridia bacterium]